jgi:hypothetical protein
VQLSMELGSRSVPAGYRDYRGSQPPCSHGTLWVPVAIPPALRAFDDRVRNGRVSYTVAADQTVCHFVPLLIRPPTALLPGLASPNRYFRSGLNSMRSTSKASRVKPSA